MIGGEIKDGGNREIQVTCPLQLEGREFEHVGIDWIAKQLKRWCPQVPTNRDIETTRGEQLPHKGCHCRFSVRAGNTNNRRLSLTRKQIDVAAHFDIERPRQADHSRIHCYARGGDQQINLLKYGLTDLSEMRFNALKFAT